MTERLRLIDSLFDVAHDGSYACIRYSEDGCIIGVCLRRVVQLADNGIGKFEVHLPLGTSEEEAIKVATQLYDLYIISQGVQS